MNKLGEKMIQRAKRSHTLQDLHQFQGRLNKIPRHSSAQSVPFKSIIKSDADYACQNSILKAKNEQKQLRAMIGNINRETVYLINSIRPKKQQKRQPNRQLFSNKQLQNSNAKILSLQSQIDNLEKQTKILSLQKNRKELPLMIDIIQEQKQKLAAKISELKRVIQKNGRQLVRRNESAEQKTQLFGLYQHSRVLQAKKTKLIEDNWKVMQENQVISIKIRQFESTIKLYQADIIKADSDNATNREIKYKQKSQKKDLLQRNKDRQRRHLQSIYFQKMKDLQYEMNCCQAIDSKINELQERINNHKADISILRATLTPLFVEKQN